MKRLLTTLATALVATSTYACASSDGSETDGPGRNSLIKAPPFRYGNTCTKVVASAVATASDEKRTPLCLEQRACWDDVPKPSTVPVGSATYHSRTYYKDVAWFEGTCEHQVPVACDARPRASACAACKYAICCGSVAVCEDDPNCVAIEECITACGGDADCTTSCRTRGDDVAATNHSRALSCVDDWCQDECQTAD